MKYVVKGNCIIFWLCIIKGKSLWWNILNMADPFEHTSMHFKTSILSLRERVLFVNLMVYSQIPQQRGLWLEPEAGNTIHISHLGGQNPGTGALVY